MATSQHPKENVGDLLCKLVASTQPKLASKITTLLLECLSVAELLFLLQSPPALDAKVKLALVELQKHPKA